MPNWDDEFDLDDYDPKKPPAKPKPQQKKPANQDDFFDLDDAPPPNPTKLPSLPAPPAKLAKQPPSKNNYDDYEEIDEEVAEVKSPARKQAAKNKYQEIHEEEQEVKPAPNKLLPTISKQPSDAKKIPAKEPPKPVEQDLDEEEFYESLEENKPKLPPKSQPQTAKKEEEEVPDYEEEFDDYGEDFEDIEEIPPKQPPKKSQTTANLKPKEKASLKEEKLKTEQKKLVINTNKVFTNKEQKQKEKPAVPPPPKPPMKENTKQPSKKTIEPSKISHGAVSQQKPMQRSASKRSLQSNDSRKPLGNSKVSGRRRTTESTPSRHLDLVQKQFPEGEDRIGEYPPEKLSRLNEQVREMIRKFNEELNELINRNMILLKEKPIQRTHNAEEKQRVLEEQLKSGATALEVIENELERLRGREGQLREQEYQLIMEKRIEEAKESIKETGKQVTRLKAEVNSEGNKLSKQEVERRIAQELHQIKLMLIQTKKEEEKNEAKLEKVEKMAEELESKNSDKDYELSEQIDQARDKGVTLNVREGTKKRYQQLKLKAITLENHKRVTQSLGKSKCDHLSHENDQMRNSLRSLESQVANIHQSIEHAQEESLKLIKKARENPKLSPALAETLDRITKSIEENQALNYYQIRTEGNHSQASERPLKNSMYQNMGSKQKPVMRGNSSKKQPGSATRQKAPTPPAVPPPASDEINLMKPNFMKKKDKHEATPAEERNKSYDRVWNEEEERRKQEEEKRKQEAEKRRQEEERARLEEEKRKEREAAAEEQKKKPFNLKKNRMNNQKEKTAEPSPEIIKIAETLELKVPQQPKEEEKPSIGPKFMRLNKNKNADNKNDISVQKPIEEVKKPIIEEPKAEAKPEQEQPVFVPKRFNLRNKIEKKDEGYVPTAEKSIDVKKEEPKKEQPKKEQPKKEEPKKQYAPNFSFKEEDPFKAPTLEGKKVENDIKIEVPEDKPKFNLRLRDRQKKEAEQSYIPSRLTEVDPKPKAQSGGYNPFDREPIKKQQPKPYQPSFKIAEEKPIKPSLDVTPPTKQISKEPVYNPYAQAVKEEPIANPYAPKEDPPKREREGPLKKNKLLSKGPKEKFNIYEQAEDITQAAHVPTHGPQQQIPVNEPPTQINLAKTDELDLNAMLGIKKKEKASDLDDLLGEVAVGKKKQRKKNNDFFNDLEL